uniref:low-density lipoprotein receptor-like n=1 Tax=Styela clava TaxID=7725 RepID=UPI001939D4C2|nr:low-density lipoprotein receptor-like [Styela clava]
MLRAAIAVFVLALISCGLGSTPISITDPFRLLTLFRPFSINDWHCNGTNKTIRESWVCDGDIDCPNGIDEHISSCNKTECASDEFDCGGSTCIVGKWVCDGDPDCIQGEDEENCSGDADQLENCTFDQWRCANGQCIENLWLCDGDLDCDDESDEHRQMCTNMTNCEADFAEYV